MEDLEGAPGSPALQYDEEPQGLNDPGDPLNPGIEEEGRPNAPLGDPTADVDALEDEEAPETVQQIEDAELQDEDAAAGPPTPGDSDKDEDDDLDEESELDDLDETQFQDFDPSALNIPSKPVAVDESNVGLIGVHKRKRTEEEELERERKKKKKKEGRREKPKRRKHRDEDDNFEGGEEIDGKRARKGKTGADGSKVRRERAATPEEDLENLTPEERTYTRPNSEETFERY
jgi:transcription factor SPN1